MDLDAKSLSIVFYAGQSLDDAAIIKLVKKAGYSVTKISRKDGTEFTPPAKG